MADLTITAASVAKSTGTAIDGTAGAAATIAQGKSVYLDTSVTPNVWKLAQADGTAAEAGDAGVGIALNAASPGQPFKIHTDGIITIGATVDPGNIYCVSAAAGGICPYADLVNTQYTTILGIGINTTQIRLTPHASGVVNA